MLQRSHLTDLRLFDAAEGWRSQGALSTAHWLSWRVGLEMGASREKVRVARALGGLPRIDAALRDGSLSYSKVRALTRVATPDNEAELLELALTSTGQGHDGDDVQGLCDLADRFLRGSDERDEAVRRAPVEVLCHIDATTLTGRTDGEEHGLPAETCRRLLCDAALAVVLEDGDGRWR